MLSLVEDERKERHEVIHPTPHYSGSRELLLCAALLSAPQKL